MDKKCSDKECNGYIKSVKKGDYEANLIMCPKFSQEGRLHFLNTSQLIFTGKACPLFQEANNE